METVSCFYEKDESPHLIIILDAANAAGPEGNQAWRSRVDEVCHCGPSGFDIIGVGMTQVVNLLF